MGGESDIDLLFAERHKGGIYACLKNGYVLDVISHHVIIIYLGFDVA